MRDGSQGDLAVIDVDLANCFGTIEWPAIKDAYSHSLPDFLPWETACAFPARIYLPSGAMHSVDRGAGQGEADAPPSRLRSPYVVAVENGVLRLPSAPWEPDV